MDIHSEYMGSTTPNLFGTLEHCKTEDSGYHTSITIGSIERSEISSDLLPSTGKTSTLITGQICYSVAPDVNTHFGRQLRPHIKTTGSNTPPIRRGIKRSCQSTEKHENVLSPIPTPTTLIAGKINNLDVNENKENHNQNQPVKPLPVVNSDFLLFHGNESGQISQYPLTPIKRNCKAHPCNRSVRKLDFTMHTLSCMSQELQPRTKPPSKPAATVSHRPDKKIDIIRKLYQQGNFPPLQKIINCLSVEDISNFVFVSPAWAQIWKEVSEKRKKKELQDFHKYTKANQENNCHHDKKTVNKLNNAVQKSGCLKEIINEMNGNIAIANVTSPPSSPRSNRFKKFVKAALLDPRIQLLCVMCSQPAKVTEEPSGEQWAECTNASCSYVYCRYCKTSRHPGQSCNQYDLNGPSPSKRKKKQVTIGTKKSKTNLRRLLIK